LVLAEIALMDDYMGNNSISVIYNYVEPIESTSHLHLDFTTDEFPSDVTWNITNDMGMIVASGGPYYESFTNIQDDIFLPGVGCYSFNLFDSSNNGIDTEELIILASIDDWGNGAFFNYDGTYEYGEIHVPFIVVEEVPFAITGFVFNDLNGNGIMEANEPGLGQVEVSLDGLVTLTNENGGFAFNDVTQDNMSVAISYDTEAWPVTTTPTTYDLSLTDATSFFFGLNDGVPFYDVTLFAGGDIPYICNSTNFHCSFE
jgi:hypothetical protein